MYRKNRIRLNESQLRRIVKESVKRVITESINEVLDGELDDDDVVTVYHLCNKRTAIEAMNGNVSAMVSSGGTRFPGKILATLEPREIRGVYGNTMLELQVPASAVNNVQHSRHDGDYCAIDPSDIYKVSIYR